LNRGPTLAGHRFTDGVANVVPATIPTTDGPTLWVRRFSAADQRMPCKPSSSDGPTLSQRDSRHDAACSCTAANAAAAVDRPLDAVPGDAALIKLPGSSASTRVYPDCANHAPASNVSADTSISARTPVLCDITITDVQPAGGTRETDHRR
jgi:hypothetical protein